MNNNDFLTQLNEYLSQINEIAEKANKLADEYTASEQAKAVDNEAYTLDFLKDYVDAFNNEMFWVECDSISHGYIDDADSNVFLFENFPTEEYAKNLQKLNKFNGMMLAFKWCYDRDFEPDWTDMNQFKYYIEHNSQSDSFGVRYNISSRFNLVYFSSYEIAQKCAEWLNKVAKSEDLI